MLIPLALLSAAPVLPPQDPGPAAAAASELLPPVRIEAGGAPIDVAVGHAAPLVMDWDGDGVRDLLVGEFGHDDFPAARLPESRRENADYNQGKLRIYRNLGTDAAPVFDGFDYLQADGDYASIPTT